MSNEASSRRRFLSNIGVVAGLRCLAPLSATIGMSVIPANSRSQTAAIPDSGTHVVLLGTQGGPNFNDRRGETANALVVDGRVYLVDCGYGAMMAMYRLGLGFRDVGHVFLTHLHDDHTGDVAALLSHQWTDGRISPTTVIGPYGTEALVDAAIAFAAANTAIRLIDEERSVRPRDIFHGRSIEAPREPTQIFADERVRVSAVENTHFSEYAKQRMPYRSVSYRFDTADRSVVFSGDTAYSDALIELAKGADLFVCEAIEVAEMRRAFDRRVAQGAYADNAEGVWDHIAGTHTSTQEAGQMAAAAGVSTLVLTHLAPGALSDIGDNAYIEGVREYYDGEVIVGRDLMRL